MGNMFIGVLFVLYTARIFGPALRGEYAFILTIITIFTTVCHFSIGTSSTYFLAKNNSQHVRNQVISCYYLFAIFALVIAVFFFLVEHFTNLFSFNVYKWLELSLIIINIPLMVLSQYFKSYFTIEGITFRYEFTLLCCRLISLVVLLGITFVHDINIINLIIYNTLILFLSNILFFKITVEKLLLFCKPNFRTLALLFKKGLRLHLTAIAGFFITGIDIVMLDRYHGNQITGYYQLGYQITTYLVIVISVLSSLMYENNGKYSKFEAWNKNRKIIRLSFVSLIPFVFIIYYFASEIVILVGGINFTPSISIFEYQIFLMIGIYATTIMASEWICNGYFITATSVTVLIALLNCYFNYKFIPYYAGHGAVWSSLISYSFAFIVNFIFYLYLSKKYK